jgi:hypothetical protein
LHALNPQVSDPKRNPPAGQLAQASEVSYIELDRKRFAPGPKSARASEKPGFFRNLVFNTPGVGPVEQFVGSQFRKETRTRFESSEDTNPLRKSIKVEGPLEAAD